VPRTRPFLPLISRRRKTIQYDSILNLPKLGADGQLEDLPKSRSHLVKLNSKAAAAAVNDYFSSLVHQVPLTLNPQPATLSSTLNPQPSTLNLTFSRLVHQVVAVPTGHQQLRPPKPTLPSADQASSSSSSLHPAPAASTHVDSPHSLTSDAAKLKRQLRSLSRAVVALKESPRMKASKNLENLRRKLRLLKQVGREKVSPLSHEDRRARRTGRPAFAVVASVLLVCC